MHVGRHDDPKLALAPLRDRETELGNPRVLGRGGSSSVTPVIPAHLAVQHDHVLRVGAEPRLHGFADGAQLVQRRGVQLRPAKVLHLGKDRVGPVCARQEHMGTIQGPAARWGLPEVHNSLDSSPQQPGHFLQPHSRLVAPAPRFQGS